MSRGCDRAAVDELARRDTGFRLKDSVEIGQVGKSSIQRGLEDIACLQKPTLREAQAVASDVPCHTLTGSAAKRHRVVPRAEPGDVGQLAHLDTALDIGMDVV